jgi:hypothetical protein
VRMEGGIFRSVGGEDWWGLCAKSWFGGRFIGDESLLI